MTLGTRHQSVPLRTLPTGIWPYVWSGLLMLGVSVFLWFGDHWTIRLALPWAMLSLLMVATSAVLWGIRPAVMVLVITGMFGDIVAPDLHISYFYAQAPAHVLLTRMLLYMICGATMIWLAHQARTMRETTERKRLALQTMQALAAPEHLARAPGWDVASLYLPARVDEEVGGDFYDFFAISETSFGILLGDVQGKGKEAAAHTAMLRYTVRAFASEGHPPGLILQRLNDQVDADPFSSTASLFYGVLDSTSGRVDYASAGHEPPVVFRSNGSTDRLPATGPLIGVGGGLPYAQQCAQIEPGDRLLLVTDGVTEARNTRGDFLDEEGVIRLLSQCRDADASGLVSEFVDRVMDFAGGNNRDDIAVLMLRRKSSAQPLSKNVAESIVGATR